MTSMNSGVVPVGRPVAHAVVGGGGGGVGDEEYFRHMTLDATFSRVWGVFMEYMPVYLKIAATALALKILCVVVFFFLAYETVAAFVGNVMSMGGFDSMDAGDFDSAKHAAIAFLILYLQVMLSINSASHGAMIRATCEIYARDGSGNPPDFFHCIKHGAQRTPNMLLAMKLRIFLIAGTGYLFAVISRVLNLGFFGIFLAVILGHVVGTYVALSLAVYAPALMVESNKNGVTCLVRSWALTKNNRWFLLAVLFLFWLGAVVIYIVVMVVSGKLGFPPLLSFVVSMAPTLVFNPLFAALKTALYVHLRVFHEGLTGDQFRRDIDVADAGGVEQAGGAAEYGQVLLVEAQEKEDHPRHHDDNVI